MGNDGPLCSNLMWPQANLALDTAQGVQTLDALSWAKQKDACLANSEHGHGNGVFYTL